MINNIQVELAKIEDAKDILKIHNNPLSVVYFYNQEKISLSSHLKWFKLQYFSGLNNYCFVLRVSQIVAGYCRFDYREGKRLISIAVDPEFQSRGLGSLLLRSAIEKLPDKTPLEAEVKLSNPISLKLFLKLGFKVYKKDVKNYCLSYDFSQVS